MSHILTSVPASAIQSAPTLLTYAELILAIIAILAAAKSFYNGYLSRIADNIMRIEKIDERNEEIANRLDHIDERQDNLVDAVIGLSEALDEDRDIDPDTMRSAFGRDSEGPERFLEDPLSGEGVDLDYINTSESPQKDQNDPSNPDG